MPVPHVTVSVLHPAVSSIRNTHGFASFSRVTEKNENQAVTIPIATSRFGAPASASASVATSRAIVLASASNVGEQAAPMSITTARRTFGYGINAKLPTKMEVITMVEDVCPT